LLVTCHMILMKMNWKNSLWVSSLFCLYIILLSYNLHIILNQAGGVQTFFHNQFLKNVYKFIYCAPLPISP
jgi:hypothetical protein